MSDDTVADDEFNVFLDTLDRALEKAPRKRRRKPETAVQRQIAVWLNAHGVVLAITDAGLLNRMGLGMSCGIPTGWPDITGCLPGGRFLGVECKAQKGRQSDAQAFIQAKLEDRGGLYILAKSVTELVEGLKKSGIDLDK